jgi:NAD(P)H dehydrogenase (quinone)
MTHPEQENSAPRALVVMAHPAATSLTGSVAVAILDALEAHGIGTELADLAAEGFDPVFGPADHAAFASGGPTPDDVREEQRRIDRADHLESGQRAPVEGSHANLER